MAKVLFLHGLESKPGGSKPRYLKKIGHTVLNPHMPKYSFEESIAIAQGMIDKEMPDVVVGSSRGGAVAMCLSMKGAQTVLVAPAWSRFRQTAGKMVTPEAMILHSKNDEIVEFSDSVRLADICGATLIPVGKDHYMNDDSALEAIADAIKWTLKRRE